LGKKVFDIVDAPCKIQCVKLKTVDVLSLAPGTSYFILWLEIWQCSWTTNCLQMRFRTNEHYIREHIYSTKTLPCQKW